MDSLLVRSVARMMLSKVQSPGLGFWTILGGVWIDDLTQNWWLSMAGA